MRVRRGLKGTLRVTLPPRPSHERKTGEIRFFFFNILIAPLRKHDGSPTRDYQLLSSNAIFRFTQNKSIRNYRAYLCISRLGLFGIIQVWKKKRKNK